MYACHVPCSRGCCDSFIEHVRSVSIAAAALPNRASGIIAGNQADARLGKDRDAFKRFRDAGIQPARIDGAADLERRAGSVIEVERNIVLDDKQRKQYESISADMP